jgi:hypothetical protein
MTPPENEFKPIRPRLPDIVRRHAVALSVAAPTMRQ